MAKARLCSNLGQVLVIPLPLLGVLDTEARGKHFADRLKRHTLALGVEEDDEQPAEEADAAVEAEGAAGRHASHHAQECGCDNDVGAPAGNCVLQKLLVKFVTEGEIGLSSIVPIARTSIGMSSVPIHAIVATPAEKKAT